MACCLRLAAASPVPLPQQTHCGRHQERPNDGGVEEDRNRGVESKRLVENEQGVVNSQSALGSAVYRTLERE